MDSFSQEEARMTDTTNESSAIGARSRWPDPLPHMDDAQTPDQAWEFWRPLVCNPDGSLNEEAVRNELSDFSMLMRFYSVVLCEVTGGHISKTNTHPSAVVSVFSDYLTERIEEAVREETESRGVGQEQVTSGLIDALRAQRQIDEDGVEVGVSRQAVDKAMELLSAFATPVEVPPGWKLVPTEPTPEMIEAAASFGGKGGYSRQRGEEAAESYRDMLAASPTPTSDAAVGDGVVKDAARYRWLRQWADKPYEFPIEDPPTSPEDMDAVIDAALASQEGKHG
jgi:hypothetical protein